jgi:hypothetical protein
VGPLRVRHTTTPPAVVDVVERTHPRIVSPSGQRRENGRYQDALVFEGLPYAPDPLEGSTPVAGLVKRPAAEARYALAQIARGRVPGTIVQDLLIGVTEAITNSQRHGTSPRPWAAWSSVSDGRRELDLRWQREDTLHQRLSKQPPPTQRPGCAKVTSTDRGLP